eukprot:5363389-Prymnesium_polylepis.2
MGCESTVSSGAQAGVEGTVSGTRRLQAQLLERSLCAGAERVLHSAVHEVQVGNQPASAHGICDA